MANNEGIFRALEKEFSAQKRENTRRTFRISTVKRAHPQVIKNEFALVMSRGYRGDVEAANRLKALVEKFEN